MKQNLKKQFPVSGLALLLAIVFSSFTAINLEAQDRVSGVVKDVGGIPLPGVSIIQKGTTRGASTDFDGNYSLELTLGEKTLVFSYLGFKTIEIPVNGKTTINITLEEDVASLDEVVVIGYGTQKKESVVAAISQIKGEELMERNLGVANVEQALQGNLPGVTAIQGSGVPGEDNLKIYIRGKSSWNTDGDPLVLVDGVKRSMNDIDMNDIENLSVLKDASATAVFGVEGANGVILITTKRGQTGKAQLSLSVNTTIKTVSQLPNKLDSYDALLEANSSILRGIA
ncbi:carboxypeptidase-like regulatory domain-containing protein, partial [Algibacter sp.]|nr:carboxypeptidase-like regulatory domain-containing protein [Algibacter sp.]